MKKHKNEELKNKKLQLMNRDSYKSRQDRHHQNGHNNHHNNDRNHRPLFRNNLSGGRGRNHRKRTASQKRRRERIKQSNMDSDIMDDDDLILHEIANRTPIDIVVSNTLQYMENGVGDNYGFGNDYNNYSSSSDQDRIRRGDNDDDNKEEKKSNDDEYEYYEEDGNAGDDEDEEYENNIYNRMYGSMGDYGFGFGVGYLLDCDKLDLPLSTIINRPFIINSKNKRIQQLELIIIDLCNKYILSKSQFQLNLPLYIINDIKQKIESMKETHQFRKQKQINRQRMQQEREEMLRRQNGNDRDNGSDSDSDGPGPRLQLTNTESNASNWYPEHHENTLPVFFDDVIEQIVKLMNDSFHRLKLTPKYKQFVDNLQDNQ